MIKKIFLILFSISFCSCMINITPSPYQEVMRTVQWTKNNVCILVSDDRADGIGEFECLLTFKDTENKFSTILLGKVFEGQRKCFSIKEYGIIILNKISSFKTKYYDERL